MYRSILASFVVIGFMFCSAAAQAQQSEEGSEQDFGSSMGFHIGSLLPNQIGGVTEIMPFFGVRYGYNLHPGVIELGAANSHAYGVDYSMFSLSVMGSMVPIPQFLTIFYVGPDMHYYQGINDPGRNTVIGGHVGGGIMMHVSDTLWFRSEMKFNMNPGTSLYIGFGFELRSKSSSGQ